MPVVEPAGAQIRAGVVVSDSGTLYVQPLGFDGTIPNDSDSLQSFEHLQIFNTGHDEPDYGGSGIQLPNDACFYLPLSTDVTTQTGQATTATGITFNT